MTTPAAATSVRHEIVVQAPIARAFSVFTDDFGAFKPPDRVLISWDINPRWQIETDLEKRCGDVRLHRDGSFRRARMIR